MPVSFLERILRGQFDSEAFLRPKGPVDEPKVERIVREYGQILSKYSSSEGEADGGVPAGLLQDMGRLGLFGLTIHKDYGGLGFNAREYLRVVEEMVKLDISLAMAFLAHLSIGVKGIQLFGSNAQRQKYLPRAASGEMIFSYALTEPKVGSDAQHIETQAEPSADGSLYILNGQKAYITNANYAGGLTVFAQMDAQRPGFMGAFIVETGWPGVRIGKEMPKMGLKASSTAAIQFRDVRVPAENLLGRPGDGFKIAMTVLNYGRLGLGAASVATMEVSARDMMRRASSRIQFQTPIKSFPLIQEKIVRARVSSAVSSAMSCFVAGLLEKDPLLNTAVETSHIKMFATTGAWSAVYDALQVAGGSGYLTTLPYAKRMRDFRVATVFEGTTEVHSIYPALFLLRRFGRELNRPGRGVLPAILHLLGMFLKKTDWPVLQNSIMREALTAAKQNARAMKRMLFLGLVRYGKMMMRGQIAEKEFFLRKITNLSVYLFGLLALLSEAEAKRKAGQLTLEDLHILHYFAEEAKEVRKANSSLADSRKERLNAAIFRDLEAGQGSAR